MACAVDSAPSALDFFASAQDWVLSAWGLLFSAARSVAMLLEAFSGLLFSAARSVAMLLEAFFFGGM